MVARENVQEETSRMEMYVSLSCGLVVSMSLTWTAELLQSPRT